VAGELHFGAQVMRAGQMQDLQEHILVVLAQFFARVGDADAVQGGNLALAVVLALAFAQAGHVEKRRAGDSVGNAANAVGPERQQG